MSHIVETHGVVRIFKGQDEPVKALDEVSIYIDEGEIFGLLDPQWCRKDYAEGLGASLLMFHSFPQ